MKIFKFIKYIPLIVINFFLLFFFTYLICAFLLILKIFPNMELFNAYQKNFYIESGLRKIWQNDSECVEYDNELIYVPKLKNCNFKNIEFNTNISFDKFGRYSNHPITKTNNDNSIAVIGDSFAMGWGVNDDETFSALLEKNLNRNVYNLSVSSYGTKRELIRLEKSNLLHTIDTIILAYCYNDYSENLNYKKDSLNNLESFNLVTSSNTSNNWKKLRRMFRYSVQIPKDLFKEVNNLDFTHHRDLLLKVINEYPSIKEKKLYIIYINGKNLNFKNFPNGKYDKNKNIEFVNIETLNDHYYKIDGHLNKKGHKFIADELYEKVFDKSKI